MTPYYFKSVRDAGYFGPDHTLPWKGYDVPGSCKDWCDGYCCTLVKGHDGVHRGGVSGDRWTAEWAYFPPGMEYPDGI